MKTTKFLAILLAALLALSLLSACTGKQNETDTQAVPTLPTPERQTGESIGGETEPAGTGEASPAGTEDSAQPDATGEDGAAQPGEQKDPNGSGSASNPGGSGTNPGGSGSSGTPAAETDEDLYHVEPDTDDSDEDIH